MAYKTGRTYDDFTVVASFSAPYQDYFDGSGAGGAELIPVASAACSWASVNVFTEDYALLRSPFDGGSDYEYNVWYEATISALSLTDLEKDVIDSGIYYIDPPGPDPPYGTPVRVDIGGTIADNGFMIVDAEEWVDWGTITVDSNGKLTVPARLYLMARIGGTVSAQVGLASVSGTVTDATVRDAIGEIEHYCTATAQMHAVSNGSGLVTVTPTIGGLTPTSPAQSRTYTGTDWSVTDNVFSYVSTLATSTDTFSQCCGSSSATLYPPRQAAYTGVIRSFAEAYPNTLAAIIFGDPDHPTGRVVTAAGGTWGATLTQEKWTWNFYAGTTPGTLTLRETDSLDEWQAISAKLQAASLLTAGEDGAQDEAYIRGYHWNVGNFSQAATLQLAGTWTATDDTPETLPNAGTAAGTEGSHPLLYIDRVSADGYRYLKIPLKHDDAGTQSVSSIQITYPDGVKTWSKDKNGAAISVPTGATYTSIILDLCNPDGTEETDTQDTRFPILRADSWAWGVTFAENIILNGISGGVTFTAEKAELVREGTTLLTVYPAYSNAVDQDSLSPNPHGYRNDFLRCETDGKTSQQHSDIIRATTAPYGWSARSILIIKDWIMNGTYPSNGFSMTSNAPTGSSDTLAYHLSEDREAWCLWGSGAWWDGTAWQYAIDKDVSAAYAITGQVLVTEITDWMPGAGEAFDLGAFGGALQLRCASFLRGRAIGLTLGVENDAVPDVVVSITAGTYGEGTSDSRGIYRTETPFVPQSTRNVAAESGEEPFPNVDIAFRRKSHRACFRVVPEVPADAISHDVSVSGRHVRTYIKETTIRVSFASNADGESWGEDDTEIEGTEPEIRFERNHKRQRIYLHYIDTDDILKRIYTDSEGSAWSSPMTIASDIVQHCFCIDQDGTTFVFYLKATEEAILCQILDGYENVIKAEFTAVASGVADKEIACDVFRRGGGERVIKLHYYNTSDALISVNSTDTTTYS